MYLLCGCVSQQQLVTELLTVTTDVVFIISQRMWKKVFPAVIKQPERRRLCDTFDETPSSITAPVPENNPKPSNGWTPNMSPRKPSSAPQERSRPRHAVQLQLNASLTAECHSVINASIKYSRKKKHLRKNEHSVVR